MVLARCLVMRTCRPSKQPFRRAVLIRVDGQRLPQMASREP